MENNEIILSNFLLVKIYKNLSYNAIVNIPHNGWDDLICDLHRKLDILDSEYKITVLKETGGQLDIVLAEKRRPRAVEEAINRYVNKAIVESNMICVCCGDSKFRMNVEDNTFFFCKNCRLRENFEIELAV